MNVTIHKILAVIALVLAAVGVALSSLALVGVGVVLLAITHLI